MRDFYQDIIDVIGAGGEACCVIPISDPKFENAARTSFTTKGQGALDGLVFTYNAGPRPAWDVPAIFARNRFQNPLQDINGVDEVLTSPDADAWSRDDSAGEGFSFGGLIDVVDTGLDKTMLSKYEITGSLLEWQFYLAQSDKLIQTIVDASAGVIPFKAHDETGKLTPGPHVVGTTYDGSGGVAAADGIFLYNEGLLNTDTDTTNNASYVGMENTTVFVELGVTDGSLALYQGLIGTLYFTHRTLSAVEEFNLNDIYVAMQKATPSTVRRR